MHRVYALFALLIFFGLLTGCLPSKEETLGTAPTDSTGSSGSTGETPQILVDEGTTASPISISLESIRASTVGASSGANSYTAGVQEIGNSFYSFSTVSASWYQISVTNTSANIRWNLFPNKFTSLMTLANSSNYCDNDINGALLAGDEICTSAELIAGQTYYLQIHNWDTIPSSFKLKITKKSIFNGGFLYDFEDGVYSDVWSEVISGSYTVSVPSNLGAAGTSHSLSLVGGDGTAASFFNGLRVDLGAGSQPTQFAYYVRSGSATSADGCFAANGSDNNTVALVCFENDGTFLVGENLAYLNLSSYLANTWYLIELRNFNWTSKTYDFYINGGLIRSNVAFTNTVSSDVKFINLFNFSINSQAWWDQIRMTP